MSTPIQQILAEADNLGLTLGFEPPDTLTFEPFDRCPPRFVKTLTRHKKELGVFLRPPETGRRRMCKFCGTGFSGWPESEFCSPLCWQKSLLSARHDNFRKWLRGFEESLRQQRHTRAREHRKVYLVRDRDGSYISDVVATGLETVPLEFQRTQQRRLAKRFRGDELHSDTATVSLMQRILRGHAGAKQIRVR